MAYKMENGYMRDCKVLEQPTTKERQQYIADSQKYQAYKDKGYALCIFEKCEE